MTETLPRFALIPYEKMDELMEMMKKMQTFLHQGNKQEQGALDDYILEKDAKVLLQKGTTWFWNKRRSKEISGKKAGNQWYYLKSEILKFIENGKTA
ncbi:MAG: hypothetical protein WCM76_14225 [Bacteroidota bacterium]